MSARILIIEDNPANLELMRYLLHAFGHEVVAAMDGGLGIATAERAAPDLVICDVQLPDMGGPDVVQRLKGNPRLDRIPVIAVTALAMTGDREKLLAAGFDGYLSKPIDPTGFVGEVEAFLPEPLRSQPRPPSLDIGIASVRHPANDRTLLVVDDNAANLAFASDLLAHMGYTVVTAQGVDEALALARRIRPDLIMSDVCMPASSGYDLIARVKGEPSLMSIPFILLTSTATQQADRKKGMALGAANFIVRPIEPRQLLQHIEAALRSREVPAS
jgi:two-component system cell cycle response regulator